MFPLQGRKLFFEDGVRRIDYIICWSTKKDDKKDEKDVESANKKRLYREAFEKNLQIEGLQLEYDIKVRDYFSTKHVCALCFETQEH